MAGLKSDKLPSRNLSVPRSFLYASATCFKMPGPICKDSDSTKQYGAAQSSCGGLLSDGLVVEPSDKATWTFVTPKGG